MSKSHTILELNDYVKLARELTILGNYEIALSKYQTALNIVTQRKSEIAQLSLKDKWSQVENIIKNEIIMIHEALKIAQTFQNTDETRLELAKKEEMLKYEEPKNEIKQQKSDYEPTNKKICLMKLFETWEKSEKEDPKEIDPDIWPSTKVKPKNSQNRGFIHEGAKDYNQKENKKCESGEKAISGKDSNSKGKKPKGKKGGKDKTPPKNAKTAFYYHYYPEGDGPDGELIEMIERKVIEEIPEVKFEDIVGLEEEKNILKLEFLLPLLMPDFFRGVRRPCKGVLLYGPPGTGKALLAKALATQQKATFFNLSPTTFTPKWKKESDKLVRILFEMARFYAPSIVFIHEVDALCQKRDDEDSLKVLGEMLVKMDEVYGILDQEDLSVEELKKNMVTVIGATNLPWDLVESLRRRFEKRIYIPLPNSTGRREMLRIFTEGIEVKPNINWDLFVQKTEGYSGADISDFCREAEMMSMRRLLNEHPPVSTDIYHENKKLDTAITQSDFEAAIKNILRDPNPNDIKKYEKFKEEYSNK